MESKVIAAIYKDREAFEIVRPLVHGSRASIFTDVDSLLYDKAEEYYANDIEATTIDLDLIRSFVARVYPRQEEILSIALDQIEASTGVSCNNIIHEFIEEKRYAVGHELAGALLAGRDASDMLEEYGLLSMGELESSKDRPKLYSAPRYKDVAEAMNPANTIELYPKELNDRVGGALKGHHILVFARPETGKTLFTMNLVRGFLEQGLKVLYIGNEDNEKAMLPRFMCSFIGITKEEFRRLSEEEVDEALYRAGNDNFFFAHLEPGTYQQIRGLIRHVGPDVVVVDQIRNVLTGGDGLTVSLEKSGTEMRNIGNEFDVLAVSITQAGESASNKLVLGLSDIDSSKTGLPAQIDLMIGIGVNEEYESRSKRMVSLPKNKLSGDHSYFSITVDEQKSRVL